MGLPHLAASVSSLASSGVPLAVSQLGTQPCLPHLDGLRLCDTGCGCVAFLAEALSHHPGLRVQLSLALSLDFLSFRVLVISGERNSDETHRVGGGR